MFKSKTLFLLLIVPFFSFSLPAFSTEEAEGEYKKIMELWISGEKSYRLVLDALADLEKRLDRLTANSTEFYWKARTLLAAGQISYYHDRKEGSIEILEKSRGFAVRAIDSGAGSDAWRILSEAGSYIMIQKGVGYIIANSADIQEQAERCLEMDRGNVRAGLIVAQGLVNAPALFGGNKKKGISDLEELNRRFGLSVEDQFFLALALGENYENVRKKDEAGYVYQNLADRYPGNTIIQEKLHSLID